jgi:hypothetical protein
MDLKSSSGFGQLMSSSPVCYATQTTGITEMIDIGIAFFIGLMIGLVLKPKDKDLTEQQKIYDEKCIRYEIDLKYYRELCKWHVERANEQRQTKEEK